MTKIHTELNAPSSNKWLLKEASEPTAGSVVMLPQAGGCWNTQLPFRQFNLHWRQIIAISWHSLGSWKVPCAGLGLRLRCSWSNELQKAGSWILLGLEMQSWFLTAAGEGASRTKTKGATCIHLPQKSSLIALTGQVLKCVTDLEIWSLSCSLPVSQWPQSEVWTRWGSRGPGEVTGSAFLCAVFTWGFALGARLLLPLLVPEPFLTLSNEIWWS